MAYQKNRPIEAADFNAFAGQTLVAAANAGVAAQKAGCLWGVGFGDRGYGQNSPTLATRSKADLVTRADWNTLIGTTNQVLQWQGSSTSILPSPVGVASPIAILSSPTTDIWSALALADQNRLNFLSGNMTLTSSAASTTRSTTWGAGNSGITCTFQVSFASEDAARYFFNTGGDIRIALAHPNTSTPRNVSWNTVLSNLVVQFRANTSVRLSGTRGTAQAVGYYQLTTAFQTILNGTNTGTYVYTANDFLVEARATTITGSNGAKGSVLQFRVTLQDEHTNAWSDIVASGTNAVLSHFRANAAGSVIVASPTCTVFTAFG
jgi:hypothetical protein